MNIDIEKLRVELKDKVDEVIDSYIQNVNTIIDIPEEQNVNTIIDIPEEQNVNTIIDIPEERIYMEFPVNNKDYIAFTEDSNETEKMEMMFAKVELIDGNKILRNIGTAEEYENVINEFNRRLGMIEE